MLLIIADQSSFDDIATCYVLSVLRMTLFSHNGEYGRNTSTADWPGTYRVDQKKRSHKITTIILSYLSRIKKICTGRFFDKFAVKWMLKIPPYLAYVATLPCETLMSAKQATNDKLQGSVAAYLRCCGVVNNQINKGLLLSV